MKITKICFDNFRNLQDGCFVPDESINVIWGKNAQGKTNLLEALWLFTGGHSFRGNKDAELVKIDSGKSASLEAEFFSGERNQKAKLMINDGKRTSVINGIEKKNGAALVGRICAVIFSPDHLLLVKEGPQKRRSFIDGAICQIKPSYTKLLAKYNRSLVQRNALIKDISRHSELLDTMDIWNERLVFFGSQVIKERLDYIEKLKPKAGEIYKGISKGREKINVEYSVSGFSVKGENSLEEIAESLRNALLRTQNTDLRLGYTSVGPHRDDMEITLDGLSARVYGSQGQQRSVVLSLKLAESDILQESIGESPIVLLDDVMSELDDERQDYLLNRLDNRQVFITCCSPETVNLMEKGKRVYVEKGIIS